MLEALALLTSLGGARPLTARAVPWFPVVGAVLGGALGVLWWGADQIWPAPVAVAVVVAADLALTGMLHLDGLVDSADGLLPHLDEDRRLAVMAEPAVGAFGLGVGVAVVLLRWVALAAIDVRPATLIAVWITGRAVMTVALLTVAPARPEGMASSVAGGSTAIGLGSATVATGIAAGLLATAPGSVVPLAGALVGAAVVLIARRRIGGVTGDVLGAAGILTETGALLLAAARW